MENQQYFIPAANYEEFQQMLQRFTEVLAESYDDGQQLWSSEEMFDWLAAYYPQMAFSTDYNFDALLAQIASQIYDHFGTCMKQDFSNNSVPLTQTQSSYPPRPAEFLLHLLLPIKNRNEIIGDLEEEYWQMIRRGYSRRQASNWYWSQAIRSGVGAVFLLFTKLVGICWIWGKLK